MNLPKRTYRQTKLKSFLFFLLLALVFWVLTKFSKEYDATVTAAINYKSLPQEALLAEENPNTLTFDLSANGFEFLFYKLNQPTIDISILPYYSEGNSQITIPRQELTSIITSQLEKSLSIRNLSIERLIVNLNLISLKRVPVVVDTKLTFKEGFKATKKFRLMPDSVAISGSKEGLRKIDSIFTLQLVQENVDENLSGSATLVIPDVDGITVKPNTVSYELEVEEFAQKKLTIPLVLINVPSREKCKLVPESVGITFTVSISNFNKISEKDFKIVCDYSHRNEEGSFIVPEVITKPESVSNVELERKKIDFLIFK